VEHPAQVECPMKGKPSENKKKVKKCTARHEKRTQAFYLRRKGGGLHVSNESEWASFRYRTAVRKQQKKEKKIQAREEHGEQSTN